MSALPTDFFTPASFTTLVGLTGVTYVLRNTVAALLPKLKNAWVPFIIAVAATEVGVTLTSSPQGRDYLFGFLNGCLVFLTAGGTAQIVDRGTTSHEMSAHFANEPGFVQRFLHTTFWAK